MQENSGPATTQGGGEADLQPREAEDHRAPGGCPDLGLVSALPKDVVMSVQFISSKDRSMFKLNQM